MKPELEKAREEIKDLAVDLDDVLIYALYPVTGRKFLKWKYGKETPPDEVKPRTLEQVKKEEELIHKAKAGLLVEKPQKAAPEKSGAARSFNVFVDGEYFDVAVDEVGGAPVVTYVQPVAPAQVAPAASSKPVEANKNKAEKPAAPAPAAKTAEPADGTALRAPMPGMIVSYAKQVGDAVAEGETVVILEAMKMENALAAPVGGTLKAIYFASGDSVAKNDVLCIIG